MKGKPLKRRATKEIIKPRLNRSFVPDLKKKDYTMLAYMEFQKLTARLRWLNREVKKTTDPKKKKDLEMRLHDCMLALADLHLKHNDFRLAEKYYETLPLKVYGEQRCHGLAKGLLEEGRYDEAVPILEEALNKYPESSALLNAMGLFFQRTGAYNEALKYFDRVIDTTTEEARKVLFNKAFTFNYLGYYEEAHKLLAGLLESEGDNLQYLVEMGYCNLVRGKKWEALRCYKEARDFGDETVDAYYGLCSACLDTGLHREAYAIAREGLNKLPNDVCLYGPLAEAAMALGNSEEAEELIQKGLSLDSECKPLKYIQEKFLRDKEAEREAEENAKNNIYTVAATQEGADFFCQMNRQQKSRNPFLNP